MTTAKETAYQRLKQLLIDAESATPEWNEDGQFTEWERSVEAALRRMFGPDARHLQALSNVTYGPVFMTSSTPDSVFDEAFTEGLSSARALIRSAIKEFEDYELGTN